MSRSRKKHPGGTIAVCKSQKAGKRLSSRMFRRISRILIKAGRDVLPMKGKEVVDEWNLGGEGKAFWPEHDDKWMRK